MPAWAMNLGGVTLVADDAVVTAADDSIAATAHGLSDGDLVTFTGITGVSSIVEGAKYFVRNATTDAFQVSATRGGAVLDLDVDGTADVYAAVPSYTAQDLRRLQSGMLQRGDASGGFGARPGVMPRDNTDIHVTVSGTTWEVRDLVAVVNHSTAGPYLVSSPASSGSLDPADGTNPRLDALDLQVLDDDEDASGERGEQVVYVTGTPASTPSAPAVTANAERLATILVPAGGSPSPEVDTGPRFTVARGGVIPVEDEAAYPGSGGRYEGLLLWNSETDQLVANTDAGSTWAVVGAANGYQLLDRVVYTSSGSFDKTAYPGIRAVHVEVQAAGGGGGGTNATLTGQAGVGSGGGGGEYRRGWILDVSLSNLTTVTIGAGGSGGSNGDDNGTSGGNSSFGAHVVCNGGGGGLSTNVGSGHLVVAAGNGGAGGSGGYLAITGGDGGNGYRGGGFVCGGLYGGSSHLGGSQRGNGTTAGGDGGTGQSFGGGGAGGHNNHESVVSRSGGNGAGGLIIVEIYG